MSFNLKSEPVAVTVDNMCLILDAKWKLYDERAGNGKNGASQADLYQFLSYATVCWGQQRPVDLLPQALPMNLICTSLRHSRLWANALPPECQYRRDGELWFQIHIPEK